MGQIARPTPIHRPRSRGYAVQPGWRLLIQDVGLSPEGVLREAQLPADVLTRSDATLDSDQYFAFWRAIEHQANEQPNRHSEPALPVPLRVARSVSADWFDPVLFSALCSTDLISAIERISKYKRLLCPMALDLQVTPAQTTLTVQWLAATSEPPPVLIAFELAFFVQLARMATRSPINPRRVESPVPMTPHSAYEDYFQTPITHGSAVRVTFDTADARRPFLTVNPGLWAFFEPALRQRLADLDAGASTTERLRSALLEALPAGELSMGALCRKLGLSARTLQRRLQEEGTTFQRTLDTVRGELALYYLKHSAMSGAEISFLLGYEDPNSFVRAFHGWMGITPERVRQQLRAGQGDGASTLS